MGNPTQNKGWESPLATSPRVKPNECGEDDDEGSGEGGPRRKRCENYVLCAHAVRRKAGRARAQTITTLSLAAARRTCCLVAGKRAAANMRGKKHSLLINEWAWAKLERQLGLGNIKKIQTLRYLCHLNCIVGAAWEREILVDPWRR